MALPRVKNVSLGIRPGTNPDGADATENDTLYWVQTDKVEFYNGKPRALPGWFGDDTDLNTNSCVANFIYSYYDSTLQDSVVITGTSSCLYAMQVGDNDGMIDITPFDGTNRAAASAFDTTYSALGSNPLTTTSGSKNVDIAWTGHGFLSDYDEPFQDALVSLKVTISGVSGAVNGIPDTELNATHTAQYINANTLRITVPTTSATSSGTGGGASVNIGSNRLVVNITAHGIRQNSTRPPKVKFASSSAVGGIGASDINKEHFCYNVSTNSFHVLVASTATSSVSAGGGGSTTYQRSIYSASSELSYLNTWSGGVYGNTFICCNRSKIYRWDGNFAEAASLLSNAPTATYVFVWNNAVHALGAGGTVNKIQTSAVDDITNWTPASASTSYSTTIKGSSPLVSHALAGNLVLLFSETEVYIWNYVDLPKLYEYQRLMESDGILAPNARCSINNVAYWEGNNDYYRFDGSTISVLPNNTVKKWIRGNRRRDNNIESRRAFVRSVPCSNQVWFFFATDSSTDGCTDYVIYDIIDSHWTLGKMKRSAAEQPSINSWSRFGLPWSYMAQPPFAESAYTFGTLFVHKNVLGEDGNSIENPFYDDEPTATNRNLLLSGFAMIGDGDSTMEIDGFIPDFSFYSSLPRSLYLTVNTKDYPQDTETAAVSGKTLSSSTSYVNLNLNARMRQYKIYSADDLPAGFITGTLRERIKIGTPV